MRIHRIDQRTPEWFALRAGKLTGSSAKDMLASVKTKGEEAASRRNLRYRLIAERLTGQPQRDTYTNAAMQWGVDNEAGAVAAYEAATGSIVEAVGFIEGETLPVGTSPDGLVGDDGILSVKCPETATHIRYLRDGGEPAEHVAQNTHELWLTGRKWIDFVSFDPRLPEDLQLFVVRVEWDQARVEAYGAKVLAFLEEVERELASIEGLRHRAALQEIA